MTNATLSFIASESPETDAARRRLISRYGDVAPKDADVIVALGGDGLMLQVLHETLSLGKPIFGMNRGSIGFLMNDYAEHDLHERIARAETTAIHPLRMRATDKSGKTHEALAINEVALLRETRQSAKIAIFIDGLIRMPEIICDGIMVATPAGSTAYNLSAHGPVLPIDSNLLALTPISAFRPRRWRGALLDRRAQVRFEIQESDKRPVSAVADHTEVRQVESIDVSQYEDISIRMLFDRDRSLQERVLVEQFSQ